MEDDEEEFKISEEAKKYKFVNCKRNEDHSYYQLNEVCLKSNCPHFLIPYCTLCKEESIFGDHDHESSSLKEVFITLS